jgi:hypothetical protein
MLLREIYPVSDGITMGCVRTVANLITTHRVHVEWILPITSFLPQNVHLEQLLTPNPVVMAVSLHLGLHLAQGLEAKRAMPSCVRQQNVSSSSVVIGDLLVTTRSSEHMRSPVAIVQDGKVEAVPIIPDVEV